MFLVPLTVACFLYAVLLAVMGWEIGAAVAGGIGVLNQAAVEVAFARAPSVPAPVVDDGVPRTPDED